MSITMLAHANFPFPLGAPMPLPVDPAPQDYIQIDPALLALSTVPSPSTPEKVKRSRNAGGRKRRKVEDDDNAGEKPVKVRKPRKRPVRIPQPDGSNPREGFIAYHPYATANTLGRYTKLSCENCRARKTKCSRHLKCLSCVARNEECVWADGPPIQENVNHVFGSTEDENRRLSRLVTILSARYSAREAVLAASEHRPPRPPPTLDDIPARAPKRQPSPAPTQTQDDLPVDRQDYSDYLNRFENAGSSALDDARALLALALPSGPATPQADPVGSDEVAGVGLDVSAAAALAVAQAAEEPFPFALPVPTSGAPPPSTSAKRPEHSRAPATSAAIRVAPTPPMRSGSDSLDRVLQNALEAYVSLNGDANLDDLFNQNGDESGAIDAMTLFENTAFEPVAEGGQPFVPGDFEAYSTLPFYQLPLPVPPTAYRIPGSPGPAQRPARNPVGLLSPPPPRKSQREIASFLKAGAAAFREKGTPSQDHRRPDEVRQGAVADRDEADGPPTSEQAKAPADGPAPVTACLTSSPLRKDREDPMLLAPIRTNSASTISTVPPIRRSSWLVSPITSTFAPLRPILSVDAAGAFAKSAREGSLGLSLPGSGTASASIGGGISALFRRSSMNIHSGLFSAVTPIRSAVDESGLRPMGSTIRLWRDDGAGGPTAAGAAGHATPRVASPDDMLNERFEPRIEGGFAEAEENALERLHGDWDPFLPRLANEVERTEFSLVEEPEEIEADLAVGNSKKDEAEGAGEAGPKRRASQSSLRGTERKSGADPHSEGQRAA